MQTAARWGALAYPASAQRGDKRPLAVAAEAAPRFAGPAGAWVVDQPVEGLAIGEEVTLPAGILHISCLDPTSPLKGRRSPISN